MKKPVQFRLQICKLPWSISDALRDLLLIPFVFGDVLAHFYGTCSSNEIVKSHHQRLLVAK